MSGHMRLARKLYLPFLDDSFINVGDIMFEVDGVFTKLDNIPDSYLQEEYGYTKQELVDFITTELEFDYYG